MLVTMLCTFDRNGFSHHVTNTIGTWRHCVNKCELHPPYNSNMLELYELIQDLREFKFYFPNLTIFIVPPKSL